MAAGVESKRRPAESLEELAVLFAESGAGGAAGLSREANSERAVTGTGAVKVGALTPMTRLKPRGGFSCLPLHRRNQQLDVLKERPLTKLSKLFLKRECRGIGVFPNAETARAITEVGKPMQRDKINLTEFEG